MNPALAALPPPASLQMPLPPAPPGGAGGLQFAQLSPDTLPAPSAQDRAEFSRAAARAAPPEMQAEPPSQGGGIGDRLIHQMEQLTQRLGGLQSGAAPGAVAQPGLPSHAPLAPPAGTQAPGSHAAGFDRAGMDGAISQIERAYMFAIETTMVSRGSTESTKIFNTLLKGQ